MYYIPCKTMVSGYSDGLEWFGANYNMNIYKGCCHGCIYCDSRSECYRVENFDTVRAKENALAIIERDLKAKRRTGVVGSGSMSDPYNPFEEELCLTRGSLEIIDRLGFGASMITKSDLVVRDIDLWQRIQSHSPVLVKLTVTTPHDELAAKIEPHAPSPSRRLAAIRKLADAGIFCGVLMMPCLPFIEDKPEDLLLLLEKAKESGAKFVYADFGVTLRTNQRDYFLDRLDELFTNLRARYIRAFGNNYECGSPHYYELKALLRKRCAELGLLCEMADIRTAYKVGYEDGQMTFF